MNKLLIVLLAICLVSVNAFVKRDAPAAPATVEELMAKMNTQMEDVKKYLTEEISKNFNPEKIKTNFNDIVDAVNQAVKTAAPKTTP